jgi:peptidoglycan/xylan/chitin deacetylase (PgdA/CDA1 family)
MKRSVQNLLATVACALGLHLIWRRFNRRRLVVLVYHGIAASEPDSDTPDWHLVTEDRFRRQLAWLRRHYDIVAVDDALRQLRAGEIRRPTACITFDDGYLNNRTVALPVLAEHGAPATIFLVTGMIGTERRLWTVELETALRRSTIESIDLRPIGLGQRTLRNLADRVSAARAIGRALKNRPVEERAAALAAIRGSIDGDSDDTAGHFRMMSWADVAEMERTGLITFGAHTVNHEIVSRLNDDDLSSEIGDSYRAVTSSVERPSRAFAYPNGAVGDFDERAPRTLRSLGAEWALTTIDGLNDPDTDAFHIRRVTVEHDTTFSRFRVATTGMLESIRRFRRLPANPPDRVPAADRMAAR